MSKITYWPSFFISSRRSRSFFIMTSLKASIFFRFFSSASFFTASNLMIVVLLEAPVLRLLFLSSPLPEATLVVGLERGLRGFRLQLGRFHELPAPIDDEGVGLGRDALGDRAFGREHPERAAEAFRLGELGLLFYLTTRVL